MGIVRDAITHFAVLMVSVAGLLPSSGETTSAIVGQLRDITNAGCHLAIANSGSGLRRGARADEGGGFVSIVPHRLREFQRHFARQLDWITHNR